MDLLINLTDGNIGWRKSADPGETEQSKAPTGPPSGPSVTYVIPFRRPHGTGSSRRAERGGGPWPLRVSLWSNSNYNCFIFAKVALDFVTFIK